VTRPSSVRSRLSRTIGRDLIRSPRRWTYATGVLLAGWVAGWGLFGPDQIDRAIPWLVPPLHARFIGALYLSGVVFMAAMTLGTQPHRRWVVEPMIAVWTGGLLLVLLWQWDTIGAVSPAAVVWLIAYVVLPIAAIVGFWSIRRDRPDGTVDGRVDDRAVPPWLRAFLAANGIALLGLAVVLLVAPTTMAPAWPWSVEAFILRIYAPPLAAFGVGFLLGARRRLDDLAVLLPASAVFAAAALVVSAVHRHLFIPGSLAMTVWFVWLGAGLVGLAGGWAVVLRARRSAA
jgi:hypothetical protein